MSSEPFKNACAPGEAPTECHEKDFVSPAKAPRLFRFADRDWDRRRRGVPVALDVHEDLLRRKVQALRYPVDDPHVGLMRDEDVDVVEREAGLGDGFLRRV